MSTLNYYLKRSLLFSLIKNWGSFSEALTTSKIFPSAVERNGCPKFAGQKFCAVAVDGVVMLPIISCTMA
jgi:hypothetical protein